MATYKISDGEFVGQKTLQRCSTSNYTGVCSHENGQKRAERCPAPLLPHHQQAEEMGWCMWRVCDVVSVSEPPWYHTLRWKTSQTVLAHHSSNYQQQECLFISITSFSFLPPACHFFSSLPLAPSPLLTYSTFHLIFHLNNHLFLLSFSFCLTHCVIL